MSIAISNAIVSFFTYFQNLGATISLPNIEIPDNIRKVLASITKFIQTLVMLIPQMPNFDIRAQLVIMAIGIPFILDVVFVWFVSPLKKTLFHILDIAALGVGTYYLTNSIIFQWTTGTKIICALCALAVVVRFMKMRVAKKAGKFVIFNVVVDICCHFMQGIIPTIESNIAIKDIRNAVKSFSEVVEIGVVKRSPIKSTLLFLFGGIFLVFSLMSFDAIPGGGWIPTSIKVFLPYITLVVSILLLVSFLLNIMHCGRRLITTFKNFAKRWGLRLLMLALDMLYIPILTCLVSNIIPEQIGCPSGEYLQYNRQNIYDSTWFMFETHEAKCEPCNFYSINTTACKPLCHGQKAWRMQDAHQLLFVEDEIYVLGGVIIYTLLIVMIGIPFMWYRIIKRNREIVRHINVYGNGAEEKWMAITNRLKTTGIFLFQNYKVQFPNWQVSLLFIKFCVTLITTLAGRVWKYILYVLPIFYILVLIYYIKRRPYLYSMNNLLDIILYIVNLFMSIIPILSASDINLPKSTQLPLSLVIMAIPFVSIIFLLFCKRDVFKEDDPTIEHEESSSELARIEQEKRKRAEAALRKKQRHHKKHKSSKSTGKHRRHSSSSDIDFEESSDAKQSIFEEENRNIMLDDAGADDKLYGQKKQQITPIQVMSLEELRVYTASVATNGENPEMTREFTVKVGVMAHRFTVMYDMIDIVIDGSTIELLANTLKMSVWGAVIAFGWYLGSLQANSSKITSELLC